MMLANRQRRDGSSDLRVRVRVLMTQSFNPEENEAEGGDCSDAERLAELST